MGLSFFAFLIAYIMVANTTRNTLSKVKTALRLFRLSAGRYSPLYMERNKECQAIAIHGYLRFDVELGKTDMVAL